MQHPSLSLAHPRKQEGGRIVALPGCGAGAVHAVPEDLGHGKDEFLGLGRFVGPTALIGGQNSFVGSGTEVINGPLQRFGRGGGRLMEFWGNIDLDDLHLWDEWLVKPGLVDGHAESGKPILAQLSVKRANGILNCFHRNQPFLRG